MLSQYGRLLMKLEDAVFIISHFKYNDNRYSPLEKYQNIKGEHKV